VSLVLNPIQPLILEGRFARLGTSKFEGMGSRNPQKKKCRSALGERHQVMALGYIEGDARRKGGWPPSLREQAHGLLLRVSSQPLPRESVNENRAGR
jgi:hypothetical protein